MKKRTLTFFFLVVITSVFSQKDSISINQKYWEDQLYVNVTYNILNNQPDDIDANEVSYGIALGYIKDIPLNKVHFSSCR